MFGVDQTLEGIDRTLDAFELGSFGEAEALDRFRTYINHLRSISPELWSPSTNGQREPHARKLAPPLAVADLIALEEPEEDLLAEGIPAGGNLLFVGYPKSFKTMYVLLLCVCLAAGVPFLGRFKVPRRRRVAIVLMEDAAHRIRNRLRRLCAGLGIALADLDGWLFLWFRPPLRLNDQTVRELAAYAHELDVDYLHVDNWSYVAAGDSNSADEVTPQLQAFSGCRVAQPGLTVGLTHHARKLQGESADATRLTDVIRNSSAFGAWYDGGYVLSRASETSPVTVRSELRDYASPEPFAFTVEDQDPAGVHNGFLSGGWLRLRASDQRPEAVLAADRNQRLAPAVEDYLQRHTTGVSQRNLEQGVGGRAADVRDAARWLEGQGRARYQPPVGKGFPGLWFPVEGGASGVRPGASGTHYAEGASDRVRPPHVVGAGADALGDQSDLLAGVVETGRTSEGSR